MPTPDTASMAIRLVGCSRAISWSVVSVKNHVGRHALLVGNLLA